MCQLFATILSLSWQLKIPAIILALTTAFLSSQTIALYDTGLYYYQSVKWFSELGTIPGLGLIHYRFATNSSWLALVAPFDAGIWETRICSLLGGFVSLLALLHCFISVVRILKQKENFVDWFFCLSYFLCMPIVFKSTLYNSISPDLPVIFLTILIAGLAILLSNYYRSKPFNSSKSIIDPSILPLLLAASTVTLKLSALPLFLITLSFFVFINRHFINRILTGFLISLLIIATILIFNLMVSGFLLYPASFLSLDLPWSFDVEQARSYTRVIQEWARWNRPTPSDANNWNWIFSWIGYERQFVFLMIATLLSFAYLYRYRNPKINGKNYILFLAGLGLLYVFYTAPALRFALGYLCLVPSFVLADLCYRKNPHQSWSILIISGAANSWIGLSSTFAIVVIMTLIFVALVFFFSPNISRTVFFIFLIFISSLAIGRIHFLEQSYSLNLIFPPRLENQNQMPFLRKQVNDISYLAPNINYLYEESPGFIRGEDRCWNAPIPCTPYLTHPNIRLRDPQKGLAGGFVRSPESN
ncbi:MAG: hypothetical protein AB4290_06400 [Spirulina sp.]